MKILDLINNKKQIVLGRTTRAKNIHISGYDKQENKVYIQKEVGGKLFKRKVYATSKGFYITVDNQRLYLLTVDLKSDNEKTEKEFKNEKVRKPNQKCKFQSKINISSLIGLNPSKKDLLFMYQWLYNANIKKGDKARAEELREKYNIIKNSKNVKTYKIKGGIPILAGGVASQIPSINYTKTKKGIKFIPIKNELSYKDLKQIWDKIK